MSRAAVCGSSFTGDDPTLIFDRSYVYVPFDRQGDPMAELLAIFCGHVAVGKPSLANPYAVRERVQSFAIGTRLSTVFCVRHAIMET